MDKTLETEDLLGRSRELAEDLDASGHDVAAALADQITVLLARNNGGAPTNVVAIDRGQIS